MFFTSLEIFTDIYTVYGSRSVANLDLHYLVVNLLLVPNAFPKTLEEVCFWTNVFESVYIYNNDFKFFFISFNQ